MDVDRKNTKAKKDKKDFCLFLHLSLHIILQTYSNLSFVVHQRRTSLPRTHKGIQGHLPRTRTGHQDLNSDLTHITNFKPNQQWQTHQQQHQHPTSPSSRSVHSPRTSANATFPMTKTPHLEAPPPQKPQTSTTPPFPPSRRNATPNGDLKRPTPTSSSPPQQAAPIVWPPKTKILIKLSVSLTRQHSRAISGLTMPQGHRKLILHMIGMHRPLLIVI